MITPRLLAPLVLAALLGSAPLLAQSAPETPAAQPAQAPQKAAPAPESPTTSQQAQKNTATEKGKDSPFDYRSSEEISEDVPVSFPVDI
jgi:hypothetical protein